MSFENDILSLEPKLTAFAIKLCKDTTQSEDLVQETFAKALAKRHSFTEGTSLSAWLCTILHNTYRSERRKHRREVQCTEAHLDNFFGPADEAESHANANDFLRAWTKLPVIHREALILVGIERCSYSEGAKIAGCAVGTLKSRANRGRQTLRELHWIDFE